MVLREEYVGYDQQQGAVKDYLVDAATDLAKLNNAGVGSLVYVRASGDIYAKTATGWEVVT